MRNNKYKWISRLFSCMILFTGFFSASVKAQNVSTYDFSQMSTTYTSIGSGTSALGAGIDDASGAAQTFGFNFVYHGTVFTQFVAQSNGYIGLGASLSQSYATLSTVPNVIAFAAGDGRSGPSGIYWAVSGTAPNRVLTIEEPGHSIYYGVTTETVNIQVKLYETSNMIQIIYGASTHTASYTRQVGLTGAAVSDFSVRTTTSNWAATTNSLVNTGTMQWSSTVFPAAGQTYIWTPHVAYCVPSTATQDEIITNVSFGSIINPSGYSATGFGDYSTTLSTTIGQSGVYPMSASISPYYSGDLINVWIDYNHSGTFESTELTTLGAGPTATGNITVPATSLLGTTRMRVRLQWLATADPCGIQSYGEAEDYSVIITPPSGCSGAPTGGTATATPSSINSIGQNFTLALSGSSSGSAFTFQWQSSPNNATWTNITGATNSTLLTTEAATLWYRCVITCTTSTQSTPSSSVQVTLLSSDVYMFNGSVTLCSGTFYDTGGPSGTYQANENLTQTFYPSTAGASIQLAFTSFTTECNYEYMYVYNGNSVAAPLVFSGTCISPGTITSTAADGSLTVRFTSDGSVQYAGWSASINCVSPCTGTPNTPTVTGPAGACTGTNFTLTSSGVSIGPGISYQWQSASNCVSTFTNIPGATSSNLTTSQSSATAYRLITSCSSSGFSSTSNCINLPMNTFIDCYCTPTYYYGTSGCYYGVINNVTLNTLNHNPTCLNAQPYYFNNPPIGSATTTLVAGSPYNLSITSGNYNTVGVWIDYNQSGTFDASEFISTSPTSLLGSYGTWVGTATVNVPFSAVAGQTKMRVVTEYYCCYTAMTSTSACAAFYYGEAEDYTVTIAIPGVCSGAPAASTTLSSSNPVCSGFDFTLYLGTAYTDAGIIYQWQSADDASFTTNLTNLGTASSQVANQSSDKYYRCVVTCTNSGQSTSSTTLFLPATVDCSCGTFCSSMPAYTADEEIYSITLNGSSTPAAYANVNGCSNPAPGPGSLLSRYSNFRTLGSLSTVIQGQNVTFSVDENECDGATFYYCGIGIWIDFNHNGSFTDAGEAVFIESTTAPGPRTASGSFTIPIGALTGPTTMRVTAAESYSGASLTPCLSYYYGETEDWCITINAATPCSGTPAPGNTISSSPSACSSENFTLSLQNNPTVTGLSYQWQASTVSASGPWGNIGSNASSISVNQAVVSWYQCIVTCTNGGASATSTPVQVNQSPCYCTTPYYSYNAIYNMCSYYNYIGNVTFAGINNSSTCANISPYYTYYGSQTASVVQTGAYPITISAVAAGASFQLYKVYIDYNDNGSFDDAGELVYSSGFISSSTNYTSGTISIPLSAPIGTHRMRVRSTNPLNVFYDANSCSDDGYLGEAEDYNIVIGAAPPCSGTPTPGLTLASTPLACSSTTINLSVQNATGGLGVTYQWQSSPNISFSSPTNLGTATTQSSTQSADTYYRCLVTCSGNTGISTPVLVSYSVPCYCTTPVTGSSGCGLGLYINNFTFNGITSINNTSGCWSSTPYTSPFYSYFPDQTASAMQNSTYTFSLSTPPNFSSYYQSWYVWIDYNDNGSFDDAGELIYSLDLSTTSTNTAGGSYTIPILANPGTHKMRIRSGNNTIPINSCSGNSVSGETEDYNITIVALPACTGTPNPGATLSTDYYVCPNQPFTVSIQNQVAASGFSYYWEWSNDNMATWEPIPGATNTPSTTISQTELWIIRCQVTCTASGQTTISTPVTVYMNSFFDCYCSPVMTSYDGTDYISNVTLNTINNTTGSTPLPGYQNYGSIVTDLISGLNYDISVTDGDYSSSEHISAWIDFDQSGSFEASEQIISPEGVSSYSFQTFMDNFTVPATAVPGITRMRVADHFAAVAEPCPTTSYGEVEDYGINIIPPNITTNSPVCEGKTILLQSPTVGTAYLWSGPNGFTSTAYNPSIVLADPSDGGTYTVVVTTASGSYTADGIVVVNPAPSLSASGPAAFCEGTQDLNLTSTAPTAISWNWTGPGGYTSSAEDPTRTNTDASMTGNYKIVITDGNGCKDSSTIPVTIYELPTIVLVPAVSPAHVCTGSSISLYAEHWGPGGFDIGGATYVWSTTETGSPIQISAGGTYTVTGTDGNGCINVDNVTVTESAPPAAPIIVAQGDVNLCSSDDGASWSTVVLHTTNYSTDLFWSTFNDFTQDITAYYPDDYFVIYTDPTFGCTSQSNIISVTGNYASTDPLNSQVTSNALGNVTCATPITLTLAEELNPNNRLAPAYLGTNAVWKWYLDGGSCGAGTLVGTGATINVTPPAAPGPHTYSVRAEGLCNTTNCASIVITVKDPSVAPTGATASVSTLCAGGQTQLSVVGGTLGTGAQWKWYAGTCGGAPIGFGPTVTVNTPATTTYYVRAEGDCNTTLCQSTTVTVSTPSTDPTSASSNAPVNGICLGGPVTLTVSGGTLGTAASYKWYEDGCGTGGVVGTGASITITPAVEGLHSYYVRAEGPCNTTNCVGVQVLVGTLSVEASGITSSVAGNSICTGNNITLTLDGGFLGTVAQWQWYSGSCGGTAAGTGTSITVNPAVSTTYFVRAEGSCNNTNCTSMTVNVSSVAPVNPPPTITSAPNGICSGNGSTVVCQAVTGATFYSWSAPNGTTFDGNNPSPYITTSNTVQVTFGNLPNGVSGYDICVFAGNGCGNTVTKCRYIRGRVQGAQTITGNASSCPNTTSAYSIVSLPGADSYTWTVTGAATINGGGSTLTTSSTTVNVNFLAGWTSGTLTVYGSMNCGYNGPAKTITIISTPVVPGVITGPALVCPLQTYNFSIAPVAGATAYNWSTNVPGAVIGAGTTSRNITFPAVIPPGSTVSVTATGSCGTSLPRVKNIATGLANAPGTITGPATGQCGATTGYSILPVAGATSYLWTANNGATIFGLNNITTASVVFPVNGNTTTVSVVAINGCGNSAAQTKTVIGAPASPGVIAGPGAVCVGIQTYTYSVVGSIGATSYQWNSPLNSLIITGQSTNSVSILFTDNTSGNVTVYAQNACGVSSTSSIAVSTVCRQAQIIQGSLIDAMLYPNPTIGTTTLRFETITAGDYKVSVVDMTGQIMQTSTVTAVVGVNMHELDLSTYAKGLYMVRLEREGEAMQMLRVTVE